MESHQISGEKLLYLRSYQSETVLLGLNGDVNIKLTANFQGKYRLPYNKKQNENDCSFGLKIPVCFNFVKISKGTSNTSKAQCTHNIQNTTLITKTHNKHAYYSIYDYFKIIIAHGFKLEKENETH